MITAVPQAENRPRYRYTPVARATKPNNTQSEAITRSRARTTLANSVPATAKRTPAVAIRAGRSFGSDFGAVALTPASGAAGDPRGVAFSPFGPPSIPRGSARLGKNVSPFAHTFDVANRRPRSGTVAPLPRATSPTTQARNFLSASSTFSTDF